MEIIKIIHVQREWKNKNMKTERERESGKSTQRKSGERVLLYGEKSRRQMLIQAPKVKKEERETEREREKKIVGLWNNLLLKNGAQSSEREKQNSIVIFHFSVQCFGAKMVACE